MAALGTRFARVRCGAAVREASWIAAIGMDIINRTVSFRIRDVSIPSASQLVMTLHGDDILHGKAIDLSDSGTEVYAVVEVEGVAQAVVISVDRIVAIA
jgi:hypothetical protein